MTHTEQIADLSERLKHAEAERDAAKERSDYLSQGLRDEKARAEKADEYEKLLDDIGQVIGCGHINEALITCVRQSIETAEDRRDEALAKLAEVEKELAVLRGAVISALGMGQVVGGSKASLTQLVRK